MNILAYYNGNAVEKEAFHQILLCFLCVINAIINNTICNCYSYFNQGITTLSWVQCGPRTIVSPLTSLQHPALHRFTFCLLYVKIKTPDWRSRNKIIMTFRNFTSLTFNHCLLMGKLGLPKNPITSFLYWYISFIMYMIFPTWALEVFLNKYMCGTKTNICHNIDTMRV